jgi:hypothetical protein
MQKCFGRVSPSSRRTPTYRNGKRPLGKKGLGADEFPPQETALIDGEVAFRRHAGGHTTSPNRPTFLKFAKRYFQATGK